MLYIQEVNIYVTGGFLGLYILFVIIVVCQSSSNSSSPEDEKDRDEAQKAIDFTDMIHQKREEGATQYSQRKKSMDK